MATKNSPKPSLTPKQKSYQKQYNKELKNLKKRLITADIKGFYFPEDIIPSRPQKITKRAIERLHNLRGEKLYRKALSYFTEEKIPVKPSEGIKLIKAKTSAQNRLNATKKKAEGRNDYLIKTRGKELVDSYAKSLSNGPISAADFLRNLSAEDYDIFKQATKFYADELEERGKYGRSETGTGRETSETVLPNERYQYNKETDIEEAEDFDEQEGTVTSESGREQDQKTPEEIDEEYKKWKEDYDKQKRKKKKDRERVYDGDAIYYDILHKIDVFKEYYGSLPSKDKDKYSKNMNFANYLKNALERQIKMEGFSNVMRRLDGNGLTIDNLLETMLYKYRDNATEAGLAWSELHKIITGAYPDQQLSLAVENSFMGATQIEDDEEIEGIGMV